MTKPEICSTVVDEIQQYLLAHNFDILGYNSTCQYNQRIQELKKDLHFFPENKLIICVGNTRKLWENAKELLDQGKTDPFDTILSPETAQYCRQICQNYGISASIFYTFSYEPYLVSFQDLAVVTDIGVFSDDLKLVIHPTYGPWFALRFAILLDCNWDEQHHLIANRPSLPKIALEDIDFTQAREYLATGNGYGYDPVLHIAARKSIPLGVEHMYSDDQIAYHYHISS